MHSNKRVVFTFVRMNPPQVGHAALIEFMRAAARRNGADCVVFLSPSQDPKKNPLPAPAKLALCRKLFPDMNFIAIPTVRNPLDALVMLQNLGYREAYVVCGEDRIADFQKLSRYVRRGNELATKRAIVRHMATTDEDERRYARRVADADEERRRAHRGVDSEEPIPRPAAKPAPDVVLNKYEVIPFPRANGKHAAWSASRMRAAVVAGDYATFREGLPTKDERLAKDVYRNLQSRMVVNVNEQSSVTQREIDALADSAYPGAYYQRGPFKQGFRAGYLGTSQASTDSSWNAGYVEGNKARAMGIEESFKRPASERPKAFLLYGVTPADAKPLREALVDFSFAPETHKNPIYIDPTPTGRSFSFIQQLHRIWEQKGYQVTIYVRNRTRLMNESTVRGQATLGLILDRLARDVVDVAAPSDSEAVRLVREHARALVMEAEVKQPSEVDRLKVQQKQQELALKTRQGQELLQAKQRELQAKARKSSQKIVNGAKPKPKPITKKRV